MSQTVIGLNNPIAVKRWSATMFTDVAKESYWGSRFMSKSQDAPVPIQVLTELENDAGDTITYDLFAQLTQKPTYGDDTLRGKEEKLKNYSDKIQIDQVRCGVNAGGRMTRKRTLHDLRMIARKKMTEWWARWGDEIQFIYASGARGINDDFIEDADYNGFAGNDLLAPDSDHILFGGDATSFNTISNNDTFTLELIDRAVTKANTMGGGSNGKVKINPIRINGENRFVIVMHSFQEHDLRTKAAGTMTWADIQKAAAAAQGQGNPIFMGTLGMYRGAILHSHQSAIRFANAGVDQLQPSARALFLGSQALVNAYGSPGSGLRYDWHEETEDRGNQVVISSSTILGVKKCRFNNRDFGVLSLDTYAKDPN
ncbi:N4-gp56 family major capsid protein [Dyella sp. 2RAB6]|uniref:N4-gp56 family major capsid protein n=1 Tax=Dyella sp. 2RAB6 TaxID=3232992 RepID=UPI003F9364A2